MDKVIFCTKRHAEGNRLKHSQIRVWNVSRPFLYIQTILILPFPIIIFQCYAVNSYNGLIEFFEDSQIPSVCGGPYTHVQLEWIDFYKVCLLVYTSWVIDDVSTGRKDRHYNLSYGANCAGFNFLGVWEADMPKSECRKSPRDIHIGVGKCSTWTQCDIQVPGRHRH